MAVKKRSREEEPAEEIIEDVPQTNVGAFGAAFSKILEKDVDSKKPVLSKRHTAMKKLMEAKKLEEKAKIDLQKQRKLSRKARNVSPNSSAIDLERQLKKVATKGVVALFNAISKHQRSVEEAEREAARTSEKVQEVSSKQNAFLSLLKKDVEKEIGTSKPSEENSSKKSSKKASGVSKLISEDFDLGDSDDNGNGADGDLMASDSGEDY